MDYSSEAERVLRELLRDAQERRDKAQEEADQVEGVLRTYLSKCSRGTTAHGQEPVRSDELVKRVEGMSYRQMLREWADYQGGRVVAREWVTFLLSLGRFESRTKAHRTAWSTLTQAFKKGEFEKVEEGVYQRRQNPLESSNNGATQLSERGILDHF